MSSPDWRDFVFLEGILPEPAPDGTRLVLWLPRDRDPSFQYWDRVGNVAHAETSVEQDVCTTSATAIRARQHIRGGVSGLLQRLSRPKGQRDFLLPNGASSQQCGERRTDLMLVWGNGAGGPLDLARVKSRCPEGKAFETLGPNLFLVSGVLTRQARGEPASQEKPPGCPREEAEHLLEAARRAGDRAKETTALTDLGVICLSEGDAKGAIVALEKALGLARELGDHARGSDVIGNLGMANLAAGQPGPARAMFEQELSYARATGNRFAEKVALERLGLACAYEREFTRAVAFFEQALALACQLGDRQQQANLLWYQGIQHAELGERDLAIAKAEESIAVLKELGKPQSAWYGSLLQKYRMGLFAESSGGLKAGGGASVSPQSYLGGSIVASVMTTEPSADQAAGNATGGPGLLRMALSATKAMASFLGSGLKTATPELQQKRLQTCAACEHHTGLRCKICGCFTNVKSRMLHENCPIGKWPQ